MIIGAIDYPITGFTNSYSSGIEWRIVAGKPNPIDYGSTTAHWSADITVEGTPSAIETLINLLEYLPDQGREITFSDWEPVFGPEVDYSSPITCFVTSISSVVSPLNPVASLTFGVKIGTPSIVSGDLDLTVGAIQSIDRERNKAFSNQATMSTMFGSDFLWSAPTATVTWKARKADAIKLRKQLIQGRSQKLTKTPVGANGWMFYNDATSESFYTLDVGPITCDTSAQWYTLSAAFGYAGYVAVIPPDPNTFIDSRDGEVYRTVTIGTQTWMAENFRGNFGVNTVYNNDPLNLPILGRLYDYDTARDFAPTGYHLANPAYFNVLPDFIGLSTAGKQLKSIGNWTPDTGTDSVGFAFPGGGYSDGDGGFSALGSFGFLWTDVGIVNTEGGAVYMSASSDSVTQGATFNKDFGFSVRYVKD
jgi:uncharacterized protein (TIGR02145 family)